MKTIYFLLESHLQRRLRDQWSLSMVETGNFGLCGRDELSVHINAHGGMWLYKLESGCVCVTDPLTCGFYDCKDQ